MGGQLTVDKRRRRQCLHTSYENMQMIFNKFVDLVISNLHSYLIVQINWTDVPKFHFVAVQLFCKVLL